MTSFAASRRLAQAFAACLLAVPLWGAQAEPSKTASGKRLYDRNCSPCHQIGPGAMSLSKGPALNDIIGMPAADEPGFSYSDPMKKSAIIWTKETFEAFIADPQAVIPKNLMAYPGMPSAADRDALFAYVNSFGPNGMPR